MKHPRASLVLSVLFVSLTAVAEDRLEVVKTARSSNPTLAVATFDGDGAVLRALKHDLQVSDWFELVNGADADFVLSGSYTGGGSGGALEIAIADGRGQPLTRFRQEVRSGTTALLVHSAVDGIIRRVFDNPGFCRSQLAFVKELGGTKEIWLADFDGSSPTQVTHNRTFSVEPDWGRQSHLLVYTFYAQHKTHVILADLRRGRQRRLAGFQGLNSGAALANGNDRVALTLSKDGNVELYVMSLSKPTPRRLTRSAGVESSPCWSPDDRQLCYVSDDGVLRPTLFVIAAAGGRPKRLLRGGQECVSPDWSPVSGKICFAMRQGGQYVVAMIDPTTGNAQPEVLVSAAGDWEAPSWAADGRHIVCVHRAGGGQALALVDSYYGKITPLRNYTGEDSLPSYSDNR